MKSSALLWSVLTVCALAVAGLLAWKANLLQKKHRPLLVEVFIYQPSDVPLFLNNNFSVNGVPQTDWATLQALFPRGEMIFASSALSESASAFEATPNKRHLTVVLRAKPEGALTVPQPARGRALYVQEDGALRLVGEAPLNDENRTVTFFQDGDFTRLRVELDRGATETLVFDWRLLSSDVPTMAKE